MRLLHRPELSADQTREEIFVALISLIPSLDQKSRELAVRLLQLSRDTLLISDLIETMAASDEFVNGEILALLAVPPRAIEAQKWIEIAESHSLPEMREAARLIQNRAEVAYSNAA